MAGFVRLVELTSDPGEHPEEGNVVPLARLRATPPPRPFYDRGGATAERCATPRREAAAEKVVTLAKEEPPRSRWSDDSVAKAVAEAERRGRESVEAELAVVRRAHDEARLRMVALVDAIDADRAAWAASVRRDIGTAIVEILRRLTGDVPALAHRFIEERVAVVMSQMVAGRAVRLRVNPADEERVRELVGVREGWSVEADPGVAAGCLAEGPGGRIDADLETALAAVGEAIEAWLAEAQTLDGEDKP